MVSQTAESLDSRLAQALVDGAFISGQQAAAAQARAASAGHSLAEMVLQDHLVSAETVSTLLSLILGIPVIDLRRAAIQDEALALVPEQVAREWRVLPLAVDGQSLSLVMEDPADTKKTAVIAARTGLRVRPLLPLRWDLMETLDTAYRRLPWRPEAPPAIPQAAVPQYAVPAPEHIAAVWVSAAAGATVLAPPQKAADRGRKAARALMKRVRSVAAVFRAVALLPARVAVKIGGRVKAQSEGSQSRQAPTEEAKPAQAVSAKGLLLWVAAILLFGFGDTLTSLLVFSQGGAEANLLFRAVLNLVGPSAMNFVLIKMGATALALLVSRLQPQMEGIAAWAMLLLGLFLVAQNSVILFAAR